MNGFTASNGIRIEPSLGSLRVDLNPDGTKLVLGGSKVGIASAVADALREFYRAEEDEHLGRWRWPENPSVLVYPEAGGLHWVVREDTGEAHQRNGIHVQDAFGTAAADYRDAHPEPKAWESAADGEVWILRGGDHPAEDRAYLALDGRFFAVPPKIPTEPGWKPAAFASEFHTGERFWPEVTTGD